MKILYGILWGLTAQVITFLQLQGQLKIDWIKNNLWFSLLMGIPVTYMFMKSVKCFVEAFDGQLWPSRLIGFGLGAIVFTVLSYLLFKEPLTPKTLVCLGLSILIILIQIFVK
jgi:hypothetical protein